MSDDVASFGAVGDPDGGFYFSHDDAPGIGRLWPGVVVVSDVTAAPLPGPIGDLAFGPDRALYVLEMFGGDVHRIELDGAHREVSREVIARTGLPFGIGLDVDGHGRLYYGAQGRASAAASCSRRRLGGSAARTRRASTGDEHDGRERGQVPPLANDRMIPLRA